MTLYRVVKKVTLLVGKKRYFLNNIVDVDKVGKVKIKSWLKKGYIAPLGDPNSIDLDAIFFNALAKEFVTKHKIKGIKGAASKEHEIEAAQDSERYLERAIRDKVENINRGGLVYFVRSLYRI